ncbi:hypothetical protein BCR34DRAFT_558010 [Clohesyomyces aquaticus]|uniref:Uncharacterized protein n=1 Tax=Clohesyomyces aquaticus TaxID=1231657 RepID=A0A1Y2A0J7_9PLEO|nr:hypothetical protein BCR34DRAFT_558010 [Clohesyomyces aquaticus]
MQETQNAALRPPFKADIITLRPPRNPVAVRHDSNLVRLKEDSKKWLQIELCVPKLNRLHSRLWLAGLQRPARALHRQRLMSREICMTESPDEHLVWYESHIFIKPLPDYLLSHEFWEKQLNADEELHRCATGLLLSYAWLVSHVSDFRIAKELGLLPESISWDEWYEFMDAFLDTNAPVNKRYQYGELRLSRLNLLHRLSAPFSTRQLVFGYMPMATWYQAFFKRNFSWILAVFVCVSVILSALQVGLATERLQKYQGFQNASYGFAVTSIIGVLVSLVLVFLVWGFLFSYHVLSRFWLHRHAAKVSKQPLA